LNCPTEKNQSAWPHYVFTSVSIMVILSIFHQTGITASWAA
jgi:hypothetical protein